MEEQVLTRIANRLWKCPFEGELFHSCEDLLFHLVGSHSENIARTRRIPGKVFLGDVEAPSKLILCGHCLSFGVPDAPGRYPISEIDLHVRNEHSGPSEVASLALKVTEDPLLILRFVEEQAGEDVCICMSEGCGELFGNMDRIAHHWIESHCSSVTTDDVRRAIEIDPDRFGAEIEGALSHSLRETLSRRHLLSAPEDGYQIHHTPDVPRVRSRAAESIVYIDRERVRLPITELAKLLEFECLYPEDETEGNEPWSLGRRQEICLELRFCNIIDGFIPLVKEFRRILPPMADGDRIQVEWRDDPDVRFDCKVSKTKRAVYNLEGKLKHLFQTLPAGVRLYVSRVGVRQYLLYVNRQPHRVRNCKLFEADGDAGWRLSICDSDVEWETGDDVFRHQLTFNQMEAMHFEAKRTHLSIRDAVYEVMSEIGRENAVHVRAVYDAVFLRLRTCSIAAVWAQFRPEHVCYRRISPGWYCFDPSRPFPMVRNRALENSASMGSQGHAPATRIRILVRWSELIDRPHADEVFLTDSAAQTQAEFLGALIRMWGPSMARRLTETPVSRRYPLTENPEVDFLNPVRGTPYPHKRVPNTSLYILTNTSNREKCDDIRRLIRQLGFPFGSVEATIVP
jgi:hypothetical protein